MLSRGQTIASIDPGTARHLELQPGECSFHHVKIVHGSGANRSSLRRMGLAIRYMAPTVRPLHDRGDYATLVRGRDTHGHFLPLPLPTHDLDMALHRRINDHRDRLVMPETPGRAPDRG
jgi:ectoine hydroxylase-related dioxygenase (phytanoyl-CoA dioxygenase family)